MGTVFGENGAAEGIRTPDPRITNAVLYRLSYRGYSLISLRFLSGGDSDSTVLLPDCYPLGRSSASLSLDITLRQRWSSHRHAGETLEYALGAVVTGAAEPSRGDPANIILRREIRSRRVAWIKTIECGEPQAHAPS